MTMLGILNKVARYLQPFRALLWVMLAVGIIGFGVVIIGLFELSDSYVIACLVLCLWSLSLLVVVTCFPRPAAEILQNDGPMIRFKKHIQHGFSWLMAAVTILVNVAALITTLRLVLVFADSLAK